VPNPHTLLVFLGGILGLALAAYVLGSLQRGDWHVPFSLVGGLVGLALGSMLVALYGVQRTLVTAEDLVIEMGLSRRHILLAKVSRVEVTSFPLPAREMLSLALQSPLGDSLFGVSHPAECVRVTYVEDAVERSVVVGSQRPRELQAALDRSASIPGVRITESLMEEELTDDSCDEQRSPSLKHPQRRTASA